MEERDRKIVEVERKKMGFQNFFASTRLPLKFPLVSCRLKKANFRTFITSLAALWMNFNDVIARTSDGQASPLLMCAQALRQITSMSLTVQMAVWVQAVLEHVVTVKT